mmetsp:Transcript_36633/g.55261  ORF Transcript_36633/g.55261 Transcript_36633/m.55261 type:complete len:377 (-) Transcript_36633:28-1158(-)
MKVWVQILPPTEREWKIPTRDGSRLQMRETPSTLPGKQQKLLHLPLSCLGLADLVHVDVAVGAAGEEGVAVGGPAQGHAPRDAVLGGVLGGQLVQDLLVLQVPDLDGDVGGSHEPVVLGAEGQGVDGAAGIQGVQVLAVVHVPEHGHSVLATGGAQGAIRGHGGGVDDASVAHQVGSELAGVQVPDLHQLVPTRGHDQGVLGRGGEDDAADPVGVAVLRDGVLALGQGVPQAQGLVSAAGDDLAVVAGEGNAVHVAGVLVEGSDSGASVQVPQAHGLVPGAGQGELAIAGQDDAGHGLTVTSQGLAGVPDFLSIGGQLPDHQSLVPGRGDDQVALLIGAGDGGDPAAVAGEGAGEVQGGHGCFAFERKVRRQAEVS